MLVAPTLAFAGLFDDLNKLKISQKVTGIKTGKESFIKEALSNVINKLDDPVGKKRGSIK